MDPGIDPGFLQAVQLGIAGAKSSVIRGVVCPLIARLNVIQQGSISRSKPWQRTMSRG